ncbi:GNAT family N-acetyltransferase [Mucilaginibacter sp.]
MKILIETERLLIREVMPEDIDGMFEMDSDPEVHKYLGNQPLKSKKESAAMNEFIRRQYIDFGIGRWAMIEKATGNFMGWTGFKFINEPINGHTNYYDLGYRMIPKYWGRGYATEAAKACLEYNHRHLNLSPVYAITHDSNSGSKNVLVKSGFIPTETFMHHGILHRWFNLEQ